MANFRQAVHWLNEGMKVRQKKWELNHYIYGSHTICNQDGSFWIIDTGNAAATDWEIYEDKAEIEISSKDKIFSLEDLNKILDEVKRRIKTGEKL